jgi:hypothetical protein
MSALPLKCAHIGCQLPDAILHGKRSFRPRSRAVQRLAATGIRVRLFSSIQLVFAPPVYEPSKDTHATVLASPHFSARSATAFGSAFARSHGSRLLPLRLPCIASQRCLLHIAEDWKFFTSPAETTCTSRCERSVCTPSGVFRLADPLSENARAARPCRFTVATVYQW